MLIYFIEVWMKKPTCTLYGGHAHHSKMCMSVFSFKPQRNEKKSTVGSYNLISNHFHAKLNGKQLRNEAKFKLSESARINLASKLTNGHGGMIITPSCHVSKESKMSRYRLFKLFSFVYCHCCFYAFFIFDSNATDATLFIMTRRAIL